MLTLSLTYLLALLVSIRQTLSLHLSRSRSPSTATPSLSVIPIPITRDGRDQTPLSSPNQPSEPGPTKHTLLAPPLPPVSTAVPVPAPHPGESAPAATRLESTGPGTRLLVLLRHWPAGLCSLTLLLSVASLLCSFICLAHVVSVSFGPECRFCFLSDANHSGRERVRLVAFILSAAITSAFICNTSRMTRAILLILTRATLAPLPGKYLRVPGPAFHDYSTGTRRHTDGIG